MWLSDHYGRRADLRVTTLVSIVHSVAMITAGGLAAWMVYRYLGLKLVSQGWFNLDAIWAFSLILVGALSLSIGMAGWPEGPTCSPASRRSSPPPRMGIVRTMAA
jgi:hypothetical protein